MIIDLQGLRKPQAKRKTKFSFVFKSQMEQIRLERTAKHFGISMADVIHYLLDHLPNDPSTLDLEQK